MIVAFFAAVVLITILFVIVVLCHKKCTKSTNKVVSLGKKEKVNDEVEMGSEHMSPSHSQPNIPQDTDDQNYMDTKRALQTRRETNGSGQHIFEDQEGDRKNNSKLQLEDV